MFVPVVVSILVNVEVVMVVIVRVLVSIIWTMQGRQFFGRNAALRWRR
jgi:hypothetical protein